MATLDNEHELTKDKEALLALLLEESQTETNPGVLKADRSEPLPLSFVQERLWFLEQLAPGSPIYNLSGTVLLNGDLNVNALQDSFQDVISRHEVLRTTFTSKNGEPVQRIKTDLDIKLPVVDLSGKSKAEQDDEIASLTKKETDTAFDLEKGPLLRIVLIKLSNTEHHLLMTFHHIIIDDWGMSVFFRDLTEFYKSRVMQVTPKLNPIEFQYVDIAYTQRQNMQGQALEKLLSYWKTKLGNMGEPLDLPADRPRPEIQSFQGAQVSFNVPVEQVEVLRKLSRANNATLFMTMLAVFKVLLYRYTGHEDIIVGTPAAQRDRVEMEGLVGVFVNNLVLRTSLSDNPDFVSFLEQVNETCLEAFEHQSLPFERLVEELNPKRDRSRHPLFQIMFVYLNASEDKLDIDGLSIAPKKEYGGTSEFDLSLYVRDKSAGKSLECRFEYCTELYESATIERMIGHYQTLLSAVASNPQMHLNDLPLLDDIEQRKIIHEWNQTDVEYPQNKTLYQLFEEQVDRTPDLTAVEFAEQSLTYQELDERANRLAHYLSANGVESGRPVGVFMERSLEMVIALYGVIKSGGAYVPLDPDYPQARIGFMLEDTQVSILLTQQHLQEQLPPNSSSVVCLDTEWDVIAGQSNARIANASKADDLAYVIYTSGSTGKPKGVMNCHQGVVNRLLWMQDQFQLNQDDRVLQKTPFSFDVSVWEFFWPLIVGSRLVVAEPEGHKDPLYLLGLINDSEITTLHFVPSMLQSFLEYADIGSAFSLKRVICSGEALSSDLQKLFLRMSSAELYNLYGPTEAAIDVTYWECRRDDKRPIVPIGRPVSNTQIYILDRNLNPVPVGIHGELHIGGIQVAQGYLNRPELTAEKFISDPFSNDPEARLYKTGDLARYLPNGEIEYLGRMDHQVKLRGFRIELGEIEAALRKHKAVRDAIVSVSGEDNNQRLISWLISTGTEQPDLSELRAFLAEDLPDYMIPTSYVWLDNYPLTSSGKVDRKSLPLPSQSESSLIQENHVAPQSRLEVILVDIFQEVLQIAGVGCYDNFFDLGGHSLLSMKVVTRFEQETGIRMQPGELFQQTIGQIAAYHEEPDTESKKPTSSLKNKLSNALKFTTRR